MIIPESDKKAALDEKRDNAPVTEGGALGG